MGSNPKDFSARQIRVTQLLASGGVSNYSNLGLMVYSASAGTDYAGGFPATMLDDTGAGGSGVKVGDDVFFFISGSKNSKVARGAPGNGYAGVTLFGGDVVFSGTMYADKMVVEVDLATTGSLLVSGSLFVSRSLFVHQGAVINEHAGSSANHDFRAESTDNPYMFHVDASKNTVGIGVDTAPNYMLTVSGTANNASIAIGDQVNTSGGPDLKFRKARGGPSGATKTQDGDYIGNIHFYAADLNAAYQEGAVIRSRVEGTPVASSVGARLEFATSDLATSSATTRMVIDKDGKVAISSDGNTDPHGELELGNNTENVSTTLLITAGASSSGSIAFRKNAGDSTRTVAALVLDGNEDLVIVQSGSASAIPKDIIFRASFDGVDDIYEAFRVSGETQQVLILSGGGFTSPDPKNSADVNFWVSGSRGLRGSSPSPSNVPGGTALFGGDLVTSGNVYLGLGPNSIVSGSDVSFWVSGSIGGRGKGVPGIGLFAGDLHISGNLSVGGSTGTGWKDDGTVVRLETATDYVGIGPSTPMAQLHVGSVYPSPTIIIDASSAGSGSLAFSKSSSATGAAVVFDGSSNLALVNSGSDKDIIFKTTDATNTYEIMRIDGSRANVGIGTSSPDSSVMLEVTKSMAITHWSAGGGAADGAFLALNRSNGTEASPSTVAAGDYLGEIQFYGHNGADWELAARIDTVVDSALIAGNDMPGRLVFSTAQPGAASTTEAMRVTSEQRIGIGSTSPISEVEISQNPDDFPTTLTIATHADNSGSVAFRKYGAATGAAIVFDGDENLALVTSGSAGDIILSAYDGADVEEVMRVHGSTSRVGIGTSSPQQDLHVNNSTGAEIWASREASTISTNDSLGAVSFVGTENGSTFAEGAHIIGAASEDWNVGSAEGAYLMFCTKESGNTGDPPERMRIDDDGKVGIGTTTPATLFEVSNAEGDTTILIDSDVAASGSVAFRKDGGLIGAALVYDGDENIVLVNSGTASQSEVMLRGFGGDYLRGIYRADGDAVLILSGGGPTSTDPFNCDDISFWVSGSIGERGSSTIRATSVFGGDLVVSGVLLAGGSDFHTYAGKFTGGTISGSIHHTSGGLSYLIAGANTTIASASNGQITISSTGGVWTEVGGSPNVLYPTTPATTHVVIGGPTLAGADIVFRSTGDTVFNEQGGSSADFRVETFTSEYGLYVNSGDDNGGQVFILSGTGPTGMSPDESQYSDLAFFVSGSVGSKDSTSQKGVAVLGGDTVISGSLIVAHAQKLRSEATSPLLLVGATPVVAATMTDTAVLISGSIGSVVNGFGAEQVGNGKRGAAVFGGDVVISGTLFTPASTIYIGGAKIGATATGEMLVLSGGSPTSPNPADYSDTNFFVSGSIGSKNSATVKGTSLFGGDVVVSGSVHVSGSVNIGEQDSNKSVSKRSVREFNFSDVVSSAQTIDTFTPTTDSVRSVKYLIAGKPPTNDRLMSEILIVPAGGANDAPVTSETRISTGYNSSGDSGYLDEDHVVISANKSDGVVTISVQGDATFQTGTGDSTALIISWEKIVMVD